MILSVIGRLLSLRFQVTLSFPLLLAVILIIGFSLIFVIRYKFLSRFANEPNLPVLNDEVKKDKLVESINKKRRKNHPNSGSNYLDEFLSAIKIFGYLERPVFHELTKNMTTQKLSWDEILYLDEKLGFLIVVDGSVQIFIKMNDNYTPDLPLLKDANNESDEVLIIGNQKYQLLNEIKSGVPLSTLNSTLDLFNPTDDLKPPRSGSISPIQQGSSSSSLDQKQDILPSIDLDYPEILVKPKSADSKRSGATIAIIPALAFQRIRLKYPKATAHIVTMVRNRLFKVTMNTVHNYLGLSDEIIDSEVKLNSSIKSLLPAYLRNTLVEKYSKSSSFTAKSSQLNTSLNSSSSLEKLTRKKTPVDRRPVKGRTNSRLVSLNSVEKPSHPGDLLSSVPISRKSIYGTDKMKKPNSKSTETTFSDDIEETEETSTRVAVIENIFKLLGIDGDSPLLKQAEGIPFASRVNSVSSSPSMTGLSNLANLSDSNDIFTNPFYKNKVYDDYTSRNRFDSFSSMSSNQTSRAATPKVYNTINQAQLAQLNSSFGPLDLKHKEKEVDRQKPAPQLFDLDIVKDEFAKSLKIKRYDPDEILIQQDSFNSGLYYVIDGSLKVESKTASAHNEGKEITVQRGTIPEGGIAGYLSCIVGIKSLSTVKASSNGATVAYIPKEDWTKLIDKFYQLQLPLAIKYKSLLSKEILTIDFALEWCHIATGEVLAAEGDQANGFHIILSGRFRVVQRKNKDSSVSDLRNDGIRFGDEFNVLGEYGHGESIGEVEVLTASRRTNSLVAIRDSETARIPRTLFEILSSQNPSIMVKVSRIVASKVASTYNDLRTRTDLSSNITTPQTNNSSPFQSPVSHISGNYKTITILPTVTGLPVREFASKLIHALETIGRNVISLDQTSILNHLGRHAFDDSLAQLKLSGFFATLEEQYETVVYICDSTLRSSWTSTCIGQGDCILLLANAEDYDVAVGVGDFEKLLIKYSTTARTDLCLLHPEKSVLFGSTSIWLKERSWVQGHHHIQMPIPAHMASSSFKKKSIIEDIAARISERTNPQLRQRFEIVRSRILKQSLNQDEDNTTVVEPYKNDFLRLARILSNEAVGLVLGGGGARGISHLGVLTALERHGIPVDIIGGTSIGSFVGSLYGLEYNSVSIYGKVKKFSKRISSFWLSFMDLTLPVTSYLTGYEFNRGIWKQLGFSELEDSWIKFYCNSTNITNSTMDIHEYGTLWRLIRASMSLAGLLPPIAYNGCMLLDGGYLDNLPVLEMKRRGAKYILAVDVGSVDDRSPMNYGDTLSGLWVIMNRWNPFSKHPDIPNMMDIQLRLAYVASVNALEIAKRTPGVYYLRPPIEDFGTLDFGKFETIYNVGLEYANNILDKWEKEKKLPSIVGRINDNTDSGERPRHFRRNSL